MNEERVVALAGLYQGTTLARQLATEGRCDEVAFQSSLASVFRIDVDHTAQAFGDVSGVRLGLRTLVDQLGDAGREREIMRMSFTIMRLERTVTGRADILQSLRDGIASAQRQVDHFGIEHASVITRLANLYGSTISTLRPRVLVTGTPLYLQQQTIVERIRTALLAAMRAAVLWHQVGGRQWHQLLYRKQCIMLARGLLTRATLDQG